MSQGGVHLDLLWIKLKLLRQPLHQPAGDVDGGEAMRRRSRLFIFLPGGQHGQRFIQEGGAAGVSLDFAAGGFGDCSRVDENDGVRGDIVLAGNAGANGFQDGLGVCLVCFLTQFSHNGQLFGGGRIQGEGRHAAGADRCMALFNCAFDVLRVMVAPANDNQVLQAASNK